MQELFEKELKYERIMRIVWIVSMIVLVLAYVVLEPALIFSGVWFGVACTFLYFGRFFRVARHIRWLKKNGLEHIGDDIPLREPTMPETKIHCGSHAFFIKKPRVVIPYSQVVWIYKYAKKVGGFTVEEEYHLLCRNGEKFAYKAKDHEIQWLVERHIAVESRDMLLGYTAQNIKRYKALRKAYKAERKAVR